MDAQYILIQFINAAPLLLVAGAGFLLSLIKYNECPRAYLWAAVGTAIIFISRVLTFLFYVMAVPRLHEHLSSGALQKTMGAAGIVLGLIFVCGLICVLIAIFAGRTQNTLVDPDTR